MALGKFTVPWDYSGHPTLTIPCGVTASVGTHPPVPLAFQLVGNRFGEALLCRLGAAYERATGGEGKPVIAPRILSPASL